jgi:hypothetical protein
MITNSLSARTRLAAPIDAMTVAMSINRSFMTPPFLLAISVLNVLVGCIYHLINKR